MRFTSIERITIPFSVVEIGEDTFRERKSLIEMKILSSDKKNDEHFEKDKI